jgi:hypothetical protein
MARSMSCHAVPSLGPGESQAQLSPGAGGAPRVTKRVAELVAGTRLCLPSADAEEKRRSHPKASR